MNIRHFTTNFSPNYVVVYVVGKVLFICFSNLISCFQSHKIFVDLLIPAFRDTTKFVIYLQVWLCMNAHKIFYCIWVLKPLTWWMRVTKTFSTKFNHFGLLSDTELDTWLSRRNISNPILSLFLSGHILYSFRIKQKVKITVFHALFIFCYTLLLYTMYKQNLVIIQFRIFGK